MKIIFALLVALLALNGAFAVPARLPNEDAEVIDVPRRTFSFGGSGIGGIGGFGFGRPAVEDDDSTADTNFKDFTGVISTGAGTGAGADAGSGYPFLQPHPPPFSFNLGFFDSFDDIFRRLHTRLFPSQLPGAGSGDDDSDETDVSFNIDPKKGNTTSTVKVVDGHKVEVNETTYGDANSVFKVRVVNIRPVESGEEIEETVKTNTATNTAGEVNPVTSAPRTNVENDDSDERREPLEKKADDNEINRNIDDPEVKY